LHLQVINHADADCCKHNFSVEFILKAEYVHENRGEAVA